MKSRRKQKPKITLTPDEMLLRDLQSTQRAFLAAQKAAADAGLRVEVAQYNVTVWRPITLEGKQK